MTRDFDLSIENLDDSMNPATKKSILERVIVEKENIPLDCNAEVVDETDKIQTVENIDTKNKKKA